jgi:membrane fusion protein (multidrug efflux system)
MSDDPSHTVDSEEDDDQPEQRQGIYRLEAVEEARAPKRKYGDVLQIAPIWLHASYWVVAAFFITVIIVAAFARVNEYSRGPAIIAASSKTVVTTRSAGQVAAVYVTPGQMVTSGQVMLRLNDEAEVAELSRLTNEFDQQLARSLLERNDRVARETLIGLRAQRDLARARLDERSIRAGKAGRVSDVRAREGQYVAAGVPIISLLELEPRFRVMALLPGSSRPEVHPGMPLRVELTGYSYAYQTVRVVDVSQQVIGPAEARRFLGPDVADSVLVEGPVTLVQGEIEGTSFVVDGRELGFHDGMPAMAEVPVRQVRLVVLLAPWLRSLL